MRGILLIAATAIAISAQAQAGERTAYSAIASGDLSQAERMLGAERRIFPERPELMLNLAAVYGRTGRDGAAASLYREVLARPSVAMELPSGTVRSSHDVADAGLRRLGPVAVASR